MKILMTLLFLGMLATAYTARADGDWFCTNQASEISGNVVKTCGVGVRRSENEAREYAYWHSKAEFRRICNDSGDSCINHKISIDPKRTECESVTVVYKGISSPGYRCRRLVVWEIEEGML